MRTLIAIGTMGAFGALARHLAGTWVKAHIASPLPVGTIAVNLVGSFALGLLTSLAASQVVPEEWHAPLAIGFLGSFTTFSTFGVETVSLLEKAQYGAALANLAVQLLLGFGAAAAGLALGRQLGG